MTVKGRTDNEDSFEYGGKGSIRQRVLTGGQTADVKVSLKLLQTQKPLKVIAHKAYDADWLLHYLDSEDIEAVIPPKKSRAK